MTTVDPKTVRRSYSAREYYEPNAGRSNLSLLTEALVAKIELDDASPEPTATGVQFIHNGATYSVKANKEVIVCGGVINSPQILELSGIGSPEVLQKAGVEIKVDLPSVGDNLNDHSATGVVLVRSPLIESVSSKRTDVFKGREGRISNSRGSLSQPRNHSASHGGIYPAQSWSFHQLSYDHWLWISSSD